MLKRFPGLLAMLRERKTERETEREPARGPESAGAP